MGPRTRCTSEPATGRRRRRMKHGFFAAACVVRAMVRDACAARFRAKTGKGEISTETVESILAHPGESIFRETGAARAGRRILAIAHHSDSRSTKNPCSIQTRVEFHTKARACVRVKRRTRVAAEHSCTAVQHLTKALFLSKPVEPPLPAALAGALAKSRSAKR